VKRISATWPLAHGGLAKRKGSIAGAGSLDAQAVATANAWLASLNRALVGKHNPPRTPISLVHTPGGLQSVIMTTRLAKLALMFGNFVIGVAILAPAGMLPELSRGLAVTIREAGLLVTFGAVVLCVGSPLVTWATGGIERRTLLSATIAVVAVGRGLRAFAPNYGTLLALRRHGRRRRHLHAAGREHDRADRTSEGAAGRDCLHMFLGWSLALAAGLPLITFLAAHLGWRAAYGVLAARG
jgi:hypothetical protein